MPEKPPHKDDEEDAVSSDSETESESEEDEDTVYYLSHFINFNVIQLIFYQ